MTKRKIGAALSAKIALEALRGARDGGRSGPALPSSSEPDLRLEEAASGTGGAGTFEVGGEGAGEHGARLSGLHAKIGS
jgi:hypothetical protein